MEISVSPWVFPGSVARVEGLRFRAPLCAQPLEPSESAPRLTSPDSRSDGAEPTRDATLGTAPAGSPTRRQLRELRLQEQQRAEAQAEPAAPLTRRQLREREQAERLREQELRAEELATIEIADFGSGPLEPQISLPLQAVTESRPVEADPVAENAAQASEADEPVYAEIVVDAEPVDAVVVESADTATDTHDELESHLEPDASDTTHVETIETVPTGPLALIAFEPEQPLHLAPSRRSARDAARSTAVAGRSPRASRPPKGGSNDSSTGPSRRERKAIAAAAATTSTTGTGKNTGKSKGWAKASLSAVAMAFVLGITAVTGLPSTVSASPVDANVVNLSLNANTNSTSQKLITSAGSSTSVDRDGYAVSDAGELQAAGYSTAQLLVGRSLAQELVNAMDAGKLVGSVPDHLKEIRWIAQGVTVADCGVDYRVLEIIAIAVRNFDQVGVSDINRKCTGQIEGAGTSSSHYIDGGGHAVDFYLLNNKGLNGADAGTLKLISILDPVMPVGARVGQASCRTSAGIKLDLTNWTEFDDSCTHMHVDVPVTDAPLLLNDSNLLPAG